MKIILNYIYNLINRVENESEYRKPRETDTLDAKGVLRLIESVSNSKAESFKLWLVKLDSDRID